MIQVLLKNHPSCEIVLQQCRQRQTLSHALDALVAMDGIALGEPRRSFRRPKKSTIELVKVA